MEFSRGASFVALALAPGSAQAGTGTECSVNGTANAVDPGDSAVGAAALGS
ncbi:hypothetical protein IYW40_05490 [Methylocystis sp. H4A]|uniref:hypothetical protein n=1 Tax=Methylocystis sp. H4A TaxID=2785788 RepID=UPI0018C2D65E|nr:hypothetical protein [Methylocystis sp. H4A]MBG0800945.1 hypothetical protein [Methylocystis sp. H4A]